MCCLVCKKCGANINETIKFCPNCGARIIHDKGIAINKESNSDVTLSFNKIVEDTNNHSNELKVKVIPKIIKFKRKVLIIIGLFTIFLLISTTIYNMISKYIANKIVSVPIEKLSQLKIIDYYPHEIGSSFNYLIGGQEKDTNVIKSVPNFNSDNSYKTSVEDYSNINNGKLIKIYFYEINNDTIKIYHSATALGGINENQEIMLSKNSKWERDQETTCHITGVNMDIVTKSANFKNCIEVTVVVTDKSNNDKNYTKEYYAPKVGLVLTKYSSKDNSSNCDKIFSELVNYSIPESSQQSSATIENNNTKLNVINNIKNQLRNLLNYYTSYSTRAINTNNISLINPYVVSGSDLYKEQQSYIPSTYKAGIKINIISANITDYNISDDNKSGSITTSLVYNIIAKDGTSSNKNFNYVYEFKYNDSTSNYQFVSYK